MLYMHYGITETMYTCGLNGGMERDLSKGPFLDEGEIVTLSLIL